MAKLSEVAAAEVKRLAEKAAPHKIEITETLTKKMTFLRQSFVCPFVQNINKKKDKEQYKETKIAQEKIFRKITNYMYFEGQGSENRRLDGMNKLENLLSEVEMVVQYLRYIGHTQNLDAVLANHNMTITCRDLAATDEILASDETRDNITKVLSAAKGTQESIWQELNSICVGIFNEMEDSIKYDPKTNKSGIKASEFDRVVSLEAVKQKSEELAEKKLETLKDSIGDAIDSKINMQTVAQTIVG